MSLMCLFFVVLVVLASIFVALVLVLATFCPQIGFVNAVGQAIGTTCSDRPEANNYRSMVLVVVSLVVTVATILNLFDHPVLWSESKNAGIRVKDGAVPFAKQAIGKFLEIPGMRYLVSNGRESSENNDMSSGASNVSVTTTSNVSTEPVTKSEKPETEYPSRWRWFLTVILWSITVPYFIFSLREEGESFVEWIGGALGSIFKRFMEKRSGGGGRDGGIMEVVREARISVGVNKLLERK